MIDKKYVALRAIEMQQIKFYSCACFSTLGDIWFRVGVGDNCAILDFSQRHLTGQNYPPALQWMLDVEKKIFKSNF